MDALSIIRVVADMTLLGQSILNVYHLVSTSSMDDDDGKGDLAVIMDNLYTLINGAVDTQLVYNAIRMFDVTDNQDLGIEPWPVLETGANSGSALPLGVAGLVTLPTDIPKVRGRKFFGGFTEESVVDGLLVSSTFDALVDVADFMLTAQTGDVSSNLWVFGVPTPVGGGFQRVTSSLVGNIPAYQRRRKQGVGS